MGIEIERKFLVVSEDWKENIHHEYAIAQGYLSTEPDRTIRVRMKGPRGFLTIKGQATGIVRREFEYEIPPEDVETMLRVFCADRMLSKRRYEVEVGDHIWEIDVFEGANAGLIVAEVELRRPDEEFVRPAWVGEEVTGQVKYYNARLVEQPYSEWQE